MAFWPPSPRLSVISVGARAASAALGASMPPSSSSGCAVTIRMLARVRMAASQRDRPAAPRSTSIGAAFGSMRAASSATPAQMHAERIPAPASIRTYLIGFYCSWYASLIPTKSIGLLDAVLAEWYKES